jgi:hypothetical protein
VHEVAYAVAAGLAVVAIVVALVAARAVHVTRAASTRRIEESERRRADAERRSGELTARADEADRRALRFGTRVGELEALAAELDTHIDDLERQIGREAARHGLPDALWRLELVRQHRLGWGRGPVPGGGEALARSADRLAGALAAEMELVREDVGTFAELGACSLDERLDASRALAALRMVQELLAAVAKRSEEVAVEVRSLPEGLGITLSCAGWTPDGDDLSAVEVVSAAARELGGTVAVNQESGAFFVSVALPEAGPAS